MHDRHRHAADKQIETVASEDCRREVLLATCGAVEHLRRKDLDQTNKAWGRFNAILDNVDFTLPYDLERRGKLTVMDLSDRITVRDFHVLDPKTYSHSKNRQATGRFRRMASHTKHAIIEAALAYGSANSLAIVINDKPESTPITRYAKLIGYEVKRLPNGKKLQIIDPKVSVSLLRLEDLQ